MKGYKTVDIKDNKLSFVTDDVHFRDVDRKTFVSHIQIIYSVYFIFVLAVAQVINVDNFIEWAPLVILICYLLTFVEIFLSPLYKNFKLKEVTVQLWVEEVEVADGLKSEQLVIKHKNVFNRVIVHKYKISDIKELKVIPVPGRLIFTGLQTYEIFNDDSGFERNTNIIKSVHVEKPAFVRVSEYDMQEVKKFIEDKTGKQFKEI